MFTVLSVREPAYAADGKCITLQVTFDGMGEIPFTASADDTEEHGRLIHASALAGEYGDIADYKAPAYTAVQLEAIARDWRDNEINSSQWLIERHRDELEAGASTSLVDFKYSELQDYRKYLRDWPTVAGFPNDITKPVAPDWLAAEIEKY
ncbi:hypothetical protein WG29040_23595 [Pseudomonas sp. PAMC 29040]|uniref:phage tail assembly chaperone n=1 Tax=Pseudomonas sp. PAMC 29040 TaxID=2498450 RepID=UPI000FA69BBD|nr:phage tail assembly chaperone [Pseudomonas sp. PAMC 29040]RUT30925.1 hypothetical protein WG29040_23595 [Pseudomonas sp. PAMC 29040]